LLCCTIGKSDVTPTAALAFARAMTALAAVQSAEERERILDELR
jgi:hypothetical protein